MRWWRRLQPLAVYEGKWIRKGELLAIVGLGQIPSYDSTLCLLSVGGELERS